MIKSLCRLFFLQQTIQASNPYEPLVNIPLVHKHHYTSNFYIALKQYNTDQLQDQLLDISNPDSDNYGNFFTMNQITTLVSPTIEEKIPLYNWLNRNNISIIKDYGDCIYSSGSLYNIDKTFQVNMMSYNNKIFRSKISYQIPNYLNNIVEFIDGISNPIYKKNKINQISKSRKHQTVDNNYVGRESVYELYNISYDDKNNHKTSIASIEYQGHSGFSNDDLNIAQQLNNISNSTVKHVIGVNTDPDDESQLDIQMMGINMLSSSTDIWFWDGDDWLYGLAVNMSNTNQIPDIISMSWGWAEDQQCSITDCTNKTSYQYVNRVNIEFIKLGLRGVTITVASGDAGAPGRTSEGCDDTRPLNAVYPGSSPWVTSVGATFIFQNNKIKNWRTELCQEYGCITGTDEQVTNFEYTGWTSGGGFSNYTNSSTYGWQVQAINDYLNSNVSLPTDFARYGRAYPDVSVVGHYCPVISYGNIEAVDGTSCSSPLFATIVSILNQHQLSQGKSKLGFVNPVLYKMYYDNSNIFNDITVGNNSCTEMMCCPLDNNNKSNFGYYASKGYDPVYGVGTPNVGLMKQWLDNNT